MKSLIKPIFINYSLLFFFLFCSSCQKAQEYAVGTYKCGKVEISLREKVGFLKYDFYTVRSAISISLDSNNSAEVHFDSASKNNCEVKANKGNINKNGISNIVYCGTVELSDTNNEKHTVEIELWLLTKHENNALRVELRQKQNMDAYPMAEITLIKQ